MNRHTKKAIIVGASSGIGKELAKLLSREGYEVGMAARREDLLLSIQKELPEKSYCKKIDIRNVDHTREGLASLIDEMGTVDLIIISAGVGYINSQLELVTELETIETNVVGFTVAANVAFRHFLGQGFGQLVGISSVAAIRGGADTPAYNASKAFLSNYLEGLSKKGAKLSIPIVVTDVQAGFVDTDMAKGEGLFWVSPVSKAARQIYNAIVRRQSRVVVTKRWRIVVWVLKYMPVFFYRRL